MTNRVEPLTKPCDYCKTIYTVQCRARLNRSHYCTPRCRQLGRYASGEWSMEKVKRRKGHSPNYWQPRNCKTCGNIYTPRGQGQKWCITCAPSFSWSQLIRRYNITKPQWDEIVAKQGGHCALCPRPAQHVDHNHTTNKNRGILCNLCNTRLGAIERNGWVEKAQAYLARHEDFNFTPWANVTLWSLNRGIAEAMN